MVGILIVTHGNFGEELLRSAELIVGKQEEVETLGLNHGDDVSELRSKVSEQIKLLDRGKGVLILTDLFGGSPSNVTAANMKDGYFESLTGVNLPMLIEALDSRMSEGLEAVVGRASEAGVTGIRNIRIELQGESSKA